MVWQLDVVSFLYTTCLPVTPRNLRHVGVFCVVLAGVFQFDIQLITITPSFNADDRVSMQSEWWRSICLRLQYGAQAIIAFVQPASLIEYLFY